MPGVERPIELPKEAPDATGVQAQIRATLQGMGSKVDPRQCVFVQSDANLEIALEAEDKRGTPDPNETHEIVRLKQSPAAALLDETHTCAPDGLEGNGIGPTYQPWVVGPRVGLGPIGGQRFGKSFREQTATLQGDNGWSGSMS